MLVDGGRGRKAILRAGMLAFLAFASIAWGSFVSAYALDKHNLEMPTLFGMTLGHLVPASAALIKESTAVAFTRADWGLPGVAMPRLVVYGPYPTPRSDERRVGKKGCSTGRSR